MGKAPLISVMMPFYNCESYLDASISSILSQTFGDFELIIINDGSTDNSDAIVQKYLRQDKRISYIKNKENKGCVENRNTILSLAKGSYLAMMDGDDISTVDRFEKQIAFLLQHKEIGLVGAQVITIDASGTPIGTIKKPITSQDITKNALLFHAMHHGTVMVHTSILKQFLYREAYKEFEDTDLFMRMFLSGVKGYNLDEYLYLYRIHINNVNNKPGWRKKAIKYFRCQKEIIKMTGYRPNLKEYLFILGYVITGLIFNPSQQRRLQKNIKKLFYGM